MAFSQEDKRFKVLADFCKAKPSAQVLAEFPVIYQRLIEDRLFLPPLFCLDVLVAVSRPVNAITPASFESRPSALGWRAFLTTIGRRAFPSLAGNLEHGVSVLKATAQSLKARMSGLSEGPQIGWEAAAYEKWLSMGADKILRKEVDALSKNAPGELPWGAFWEYLNEEVASIGGRERVMPFSSSFRSRPMDLFLFQELPAVDEQLDALIVEHDVYRARTHLPIAARLGSKDPSVCRSDAGDFFERAPGSLPENPARISPTDLVLLNSGDATAPKLKEMLYRRFALKAIESDINQRYHSQPDPFRRTRKLTVRVTLFDDRLLSAVPPMGEEGASFSQVNLYRACLVYFFHHLSQAMEGSPVELDLTVSMSLGSGLTMSKRLPEAFLAAARTSPRDCFEALWLSFPQLFSSVLLRRLKDVSAAQSLDLEPAMLLLLSLGRPAPACSGDSGEVCRADVQADPATGTLAARVVGFTDGQAPAAIVRNYDLPGAVSFEVVKAIFEQEGAA